MGRRQFYACYGNSTGIRRHRVAFHYFGVESNWDDVGLILRGIVHSSIGRVLSLMSTFCYSLVGSYCCSRVNLFCSFPHPSSHLLVGSDRWAMGAYAGVLLVLYITLQIPKFSCDAVENLMGLQFNELVRREGVAASSSSKASKSKKNEAVSWIVMFHADWCESSVYLEPMFANLAEKYCGPKKRFARVDIVQHPDVAEDMNIDISATTKQLPTLALFSNGREISRLPAMDSHGKVVRVRLDKHGMIKHFALNA